MAVSEPDLLGERLVLQGSCAFLLMVNISLFFDECSSILHRHNFLLLLVNSAEKSCDCRSLTGM